MIVNRLARSKLRAMVPVRAFGAPQGPPHDYKYIVETNYTGTKTKLKIPSPHDIEHTLPRVGTRNEWFHMWLQGRWNPQQDEKLDNSKENGRSMYALFRNVPL